MMENTETEVFKQFFFQVVRYSLIALGSYLVRKGVIDQGLAESFSSPAFGVAIGGVAVLGITLVWGYCKARFNAKLPIAALKADSRTTLETIKTDLLAREDRVSSI